MAEAFEHDLSCSICLDLFTEPVALRCGHWFCHRCITACWAGQGRGAASSCPDCRAPCPDRQCTPNRLLGNLAQRAREMLEEEAKGEAVQPKTEAREEEEEEDPERARGGEPGRLCCEAHGEEFLLFCTTDETFICTQCINSPVHAGHSFGSLKDGAETYKKKLAKVLEPLEKIIKELEQQEESQKEKIHSLKDSTTLLRTNIEDKFSEICQALQERQAAMLAELDEDEKAAHKDMEVRLEQIRQLLCLTKEMESQGKTRMALNHPSSFLLDIQQFLGTLTTWVEAATEGHEGRTAVLCRKLSLGKFKGPTQHLACRPLCPVFAQELENIQLDPSTAHPMLSITDNGTHVGAKILRLIARHGSRKGQQDLMTEDVWTVLGTTGFTSGRHYWEVETQRDHQWYIGVSFESAKGKYQIKELKDKVLAIGPSDMEETAPGGWRIGVYLAYEEGQVSFYNARNGSHLDSRRVLSKEKVYPFFGHALSDKPVAPLRICQK